MTPKSLDEFRSCAAGGCLWQVQEPEHYCSGHGGHPESEFAMADDGDILDVHGFPIPSEGCE